MRARLAASCRAHRTDRGGAGRHGSLERAPRPYNTVFVLKSGKISTADAWALREHRLTAEVQIVVRTDESRQLFPVLRIFHHPINRHCRPMLSEEQRQSLNSSNRFWRKPSR
jgi:hypothetical protein